jgi:hypothetical protein
MQGEAMRPLFHVLRDKYPTPRIKHDELFDSLGWADLKAHPGYRNTCAIRMSIALLGAHVPLHGALRVKAGPLKGGGVVPSQNRLSHDLKRLWGQPEVFRGKTDAAKMIGGRTGVVSFFHINPAVPDTQGHIDLVWPAGGGFQSCAMSCYFASVEIWFWPLM